jgi:hypothetical protein
MWSEQHVQELEKTIKELREDLEEYDNLNKKIADLITNTANALHGKPLENGLHSWHDLPELVEQLRKERDEARREVCNNEAKHLPTMADPHREAERRGWDCFKENTNEQL